MPAPTAPILSSPHEAISLLTSRLRPLPTLRIPLANAAGRVLAEPIITDRPSPTVDVSSMDGYAVNTASLRAGRVPITATIAIGTEPASATSGATRIVTGAPLPPGADAVIKREDVTEEPNAIVIPESLIASIRPGSYIRRAGENAPAGTQVAGPGRQIDAPLAAALAAFGVHEPTVHQRARVAILVTGDELVGPESTPTPWQIRDSNGPALTALLSPSPWIEPLPVRRSPDDPNSLRDHIKSLLHEADVLVLCGGVSMGDRDFVPAALTDTGATVLFHRVNQRPGKPILGALTADGRPILALPGNPVSVMVTARRILVPILRGLAGLPDEPAQLVTLDQPDDQLLNMWWHRPVTLTGANTARRLPTRGSGDIVSTATSDGFIELPPNQSGPGPWPFFRWAL